MHSAPRLRALGLALTAATLVSLAGGCDCAGAPPPPGTCRSRTDCAASEIYLDGRCEPAPDAGPSAPDAGPDAPSAPDAGLDAGCVLTCTDACCAAGQRCFAGTRCIDDRGTCAGPDDCGDDTYCDGGVCVPFGVPSDVTSDATCTQTLDIEAIEPDEQCRWTGPPPGDPYANHFQVMSTPIVVDFDLDADSRTLAPSIVFSSFPTSGSYRNAGVLRVIDGATCTHQFTLADPTAMAMSPAAPAVGDLDGDGRAEIVHAVHDGGVAAWRYDPSASAFTLLWRSATCAGATRTPDTTGGADQWSGPSLHDLDDDGSPEVIYGATVYDSAGCLRAGGLGFPSYSRGVVPVVADVDEDGAMELVEGNGVYAFGPLGFTLEPYFTATGRSLGQVAVADLGDFPLAAFGGEDRAEIVVVAAGAARVMTLDGAIVFGPVPLPGGGTGGAPTIADFDGNGRNELASAGGTRYVVFDLDCVPGGDPSRCGTGSTNGILWSQPSQDASSNVTGSSVFDFDADGAAEAVYADECFLRIYAGATGAVVYSAARSSGTTFENPVIADVDGDFHTEIVSSANDYAGSLGCPATDPLRPSTSFSTSHGIVVLRDVMDRWAASRPVWSQHAYAVTHVGDRGELPRSSAVAPNWRTAGLDNFRQNVQGDLAALGTPDLTATGTSDRLRLPCDASGVAALRARVCNRGALPMAAGFEVEFRSGTRDGAALCRASSPVFLGVGECDEVGCDALLPSDVAIDVYVVADPDGASAECHEGNNFGVQPNVACDTVI